MKSLDEANLVEKLCVFVHGISVENHIASAPRPSAVDGTAESIAHLTTRCTR